MKPLKKANKGNFWTFIFAMFGLIGVFMFSTLMIQEMINPILAAVYVVIFGFLLIVLIVSVPSRRMWKKLRDMKETERRE